MQSWLIPGIMALPNKEKALDSEAYLDRQTGRMFAIRISPYTGKRIMFCITSTPGAKIRWQCGLYNRFDRADEQRAASHFGLPNAADGLGLEV